MEQVQVAVAVNERGIRIGEDHQFAKYSNSEVEMVFILRDYGWGYKRIAAAVEMPLRTVRDFINGKRRCQCPAKWKKVVVGDTWKAVKEG